MSRMALIHTVQRFNLDEKKITQRWLRPTNEKRGWQMELDRHRGLVILWFHLLSGCFPDFNFWGFPNLLKNFHLSTVSASWHCFLFLFTNYVLILETRWWAGFDPRRIRPGSGYNWCSCRMRCRKIRRIDRSQLACCLPEKSNIKMKTDAPSTVLHHDLHVLHNGASVCPDLARKNAISDKFTTVSEHTVKERQSPESNNGKYPRRSRLTSQRQLLHFYSLRGQI